MKPGGSESEHCDDAADEALIAAVALGDNAAREALVARHRPRVVLLAYRFTGRWDLAEDLAQEAFLRIFRAAASYTPQARFSSWLYRLVANLCWDQRRRMAREVRRSARAARLRSGTVALSDLDAIERAERVRMAVAALPARQRLAVVLHRFDGLSHREIAEACGWTESAVESCLVRAYERLRKLLSDLE